MKKKMLTPYTTTSTTSSSKSNSSNALITSNGHLIESTNIKMPIITSPTALKNRKNYSITSPLKINRSDQLITAAQNVIINQQQHQQQQNSSIRQVCFDIDPNIVITSCRSPSPNTLSSSTTNSLQLNGYMEQLLLDHDQDQDHDDNTTSASSLSSTKIPITNNKQQQKQPKEMAKKNLNVDLNTDCNMKVKNSPKHLLYEVLLSPIKRKVFLLCLSIDTH